MYDRVSRVFLAVLLAVAGAQAAIQVARAQEGGSPHWEADANSALTELRRHHDELELRVSDIRSTRPLAKRRALVRRVRSTLAQARKAAARLKRSIAEGRRTGELGDAVAKVWERILESHTAGLDELASSIPDLPTETPPTGTAKPPDPEPSPAKPAPKPPAHLAKIQGFLAEIESARRKAEKRFQGQPLKRAMLAAFRRHGATDKHGWAGPWSDFLWIHSFAAVGGNEHRSLTHAMETFRRHAAQTWGTPEQTYLRYLSGSMKIWRKELRQRIQLLEQVLDLRGQQAALWEKGARAAGEAIDGLADALEKKLGEPYTAVKPFLQWKKDMRAAEKALTSDRARRQDGQNAPPAEVRKLIGRLVEELKQRKLPSRWLGTLLKDTPAMKFSKDRTTRKDNSGVYDPNDDTVYLRPESNLGVPTRRDKRLLVHELFHAWVKRSKTGLSDAQEEAVAGFLEERYNGSGMSAAMGRALTEASAPDREGSPADAFLGLAKLEELWRKQGEPSLFSGGFKSSGDRARWESLKRVGTFRHLAPVFDQLRRRFEKAE